MSVAISQCNNKSAGSATCLPATSVTHTTTHRSVRLRRQMAAVCLLTYTDCIFKNYSKKSLKSNIGCRHKHERRRIFYSDPKSEFKTLNCCNKVLFMLHYKVSRHMKSDVLILIFRLALSSRFNRVTLCYHILLFVLQQ